MPRHGSIYRIVHRESGKVYVGQTTLPVEVRWKEHRTKNKEGSLIARAIRKYGADAFLFEEVASGLDQPSLNDSEVIVGMQEQALHPTGFSLKLGAGKGTVAARSKEKTRQSLLGHAVSQEARERIRETKLRDPNRHAHAKHASDKAALVNTGKPRSEETRQRISDAKKGWDPSEETRARMRESHLGKKHSEETRAKMRAAHAARKKTPEEIRERRAEAQRARRAASKEKHGHTDLD
jgi:group I intron endonuclease